MSDCLKKLKAEPMAPGFWSALQWLHEMRQVNLRAIFTSKWSVETFEPPFFWRKHQGLPLYPVTQSILESEKKVLGPGESNPAPKKSADCWANSLSSALLALQPPEYGMTPMTYGNQNMGRG